MKAYEIDYKACYITEGKRNNNWLLCQIIDLSKTANITKYNK